VVAVVAAGVAVVEEAVAEVVEEVMVEEVSRTRYRHVLISFTGGYSGGGGAGGGGQMGNNQQFSNPGGPPPPQQFKPPGPPTPLVPSQAAGPSGTAIQTQQVTIPNQVSNPDYMVCIIFNFVVSMLMPSLVLVDLGLIRLLDKVVVR